MKDKKHYVATVKMIVAADDPEQAIKLINNRLNPAPEETGCSLTDWGFVATGPDSRGLPRHVAIDEDFLKLKDQVKYDETIVPSLDVEELEIDERRKEYEMLFDHL